MMTKKDYIKFAQVFNETKPEEPKDYELWIKIVNKFASMLQAGNPQFNKGTFIAACEGD